MRKFRIAIIILSFLIIITFLVIFDYNKLMTKSNLGFLLGIISAILNIIAMVLSNRYEAKNKNTSIT